MLFYLTKSLVVDANDNCYQKICNAVMNIAMQVANGSHLLVGDFEAICHFRRCFRETPVVGLLFDGIYQNYATMSVPSFLTFYVEVVKDSPVARVCNGVTIGQRCYSHYLNLDVVSESRLVCEDLTDALFVGHILKWYGLQIGINVAHAYHPLSGGGNNTWRVVENELKCHHITICIVDTDMRYPNCDGDPDSTYKKCKDNIENSSIEYKLLALDVHEIENIVPLNYIDSFAIWTNGNPNDMAHKRAFDCLRSDAENILPYFDYKKGIKKRDIVESEPYWNFAAKCYRTNAEKFAKEPNFKKYVDSIVNKEVYPHLLGGTGTIKSAIDLIESGEAPVPILLKFQHDNWCKIGQAMLDWCIARKNEALT